MGKTNIVIVGAGGFAKEVYEVLMRKLDWLKEDYEFAGFLDDNKELHDSNFMQSSVLGGLDWLKENEDTEIILGIGSPVIKKILVEKISKIGKFKFMSLVDSESFMGEDVRVGEGVFIGGGCHITTNIDIQDFVTINLACTVGHDSILETYATVAPGVNISGNCLIKEGVDFGTGATIIQGKSVGEWSIVGAGSVVVKDIPANTTSVGNPSKVIKERVEGWHIPKETVQEESYETSK